MSLRYVVSFISLCSKVHSVSCYIICIFLLYRLNIFYLPCKLIHLDFFPLAQYSHDTTATNEINEVLLPMGCYTD